MVFSFCIKNVLPAHTKNIKEEHMQKFNPGDIAPKTCKYCVCDKDGKVLDRIDVKEGDHLPPTQSSEYYYTCDC